MRKSPSSIPGIYLITNAITGKLYVGQAINIRRRWESHRHYLAAGAHRNGHLQRSWNKRGPEAFVFSIHLDLSAVPCSELKSAMDAAEIEVLLAHPQNYNLMKAGISAPIAGPETRAIWSAQRKAMWANPVFKNNRSEATKALYADPEWKARRDLSVREALQSPGFKATCSKRFTEMWQDPTHQMAQSAKRTANWQDPEYRAKQHAARCLSANNPEIKKRRADSIRAAHARRRAAQATTFPQET